MTALWEGRMRSSVLNFLIAGSLLVAYLRTAVSSIGRGENAARTLKEFNIVRDFHSVGRWGTDHRRGDHSAPLK
jgi:hypothetical protein